ncbi:hypothetical protein KGF57_004207 [Candida theae]|uniref:Uncharacterized protein n=1 Tax=Candida theae TaxID=1198502 RepID=A0AAD5BC61_9ASCO|nr:uncharacterized protein KGF57_004207 [Candida theae]KAI5952115.1 hypothetical protein KGF57_004207 [Candida theae]
MTQEPSVDIASTYQQINEAEKQASKLESMLDSFEAKLDSILKDAENINSTEDEKQGDIARSESHSQQEPLHSTEQTGGTKSSQEQN